MKRILYIIVLVCLPIFACAQTDSVRTSTTSDSIRIDKHGIARHKDGTRIYPDSAVYRGMSLKLDLGNTILELAMSKAKIQSYEIAMNWQVISRLFPTLELGYSQADSHAEGGKHHGIGGFGRVGLDINPLKKHPESLNMLLVGLRVGTGLQQFTLSDVAQHADPYWYGTNNKWQQYTYPATFRADAWGEVVAGCQVHVWEGLQMGWYVRLKILFTRTNKEGGPLPYYIPGFGYRDDTNWGMNYYIGYKF